MPHYHIPSHQMKTPLSVTVEEDVALGANSQAVKERRTLSNLVEVALAEYLAARGVKVDAPIDGTLALIHESEEAGVDVDKTLKAAIRRARQTKAK